MVVVEKRMEYFVLKPQPNSNTSWTRLRTLTGFCVGKILTWLSVPKYVASRVLFKIAKVTYKLAKALDSKDISNKDSLTFGAEVLPHIQRPINPWEELLCNKPTVLKELEERFGSPQQKCQNWVNSSPEIDGNVSTASETGVNNNDAEDDSISVQSGHSKTSSDTSAYSIPNMAKGTKWGFTVIFNMINFSEEGLDQRYGAENDEELIKEFLTELGSDVDIHRDMSKKELLEKLEEYSKKDHSPNCNFLCFIMSHGSEKGIFCSDGELVSLSDAMNPFGKSQCPSLKNKPKIFVIDACLGDNEQSPMYGREGPLRSKVWDSGISGLSSTSDRVIGPQEEDFLILYTTVPGHVSYRSDFGPQT